MPVYDPFTNVVRLVFRIHVDLQPRQTFDILARHARRPGVRNDTSLFSIHELEYDELLDVISEKLRRPSGTGLLPGEQLHLRVFSYKSGQFCDVKTTEQLWHQVCSALDREIRRMDFIAAIRSDTNSLSTSKLNAVSHRSTSSGLSPSTSSGLSPSTSSGLSPSTSSGLSPSTPSGESPSDFNNGDSPSDFATLNGDSPSDFNDGEPPSYFDNGESPFEFNDADFSNFNDAGPSNFNGASSSNSNGASSSNSNGASSSNSDDASSSTFNEAFAYQSDGVSPSAPSGVSS